MAKQQASKTNAKTTKRREKKNVPQGFVVVNTGSNNTHITITDGAGNVLCRSSAGQMGFKGSRKSTPFAAQVAAEDAATKAIETCNMREVDVRMTGPGTGRESAIRALQARGLVVKTIKDVTPLPHNGCRARKRRRV